MGLYADKVKEHADRIAALADLEEIARIGDAILANFEEAGTKWVGDTDTRKLQVGLSHRLFIVAKGVSKPAELLDLIRFISKQPGVKRDGDAIKDTYAPGMSWSWNNKAIGLDATWSGPQALCRRVQVGTKMVEQPIYEIICDDDGVKDD